MKRPADQAKLLFLYLLRSSAAALASTPAKCDHILLRLAKRTDVPSIQRCNLATLPENYNSQFYVNHMRQWPDLCLVAEHVREDSPQPRRFQYNGFPGIKPEPRIVGYVLGKVEEQVKQPPFSLPRSLSPQDRDDFYESLCPETELLGHVTSLAVLQDHRRCGLACALMKQLHYHLQQRDCSGVGLHVRKSNVAAARLYQGDGYQIANIIPHYYQDGEDAYFMKKELCESITASPITRISNKIRPWEQVGPYQLPRDLVLPDKNVVTPSPGEPQISITGTL